MTISPEPIADSVPSQSPQMHEEREGFSRRGVFSAMGAVSALPIAAAADAAFAGSLAQAQAQDLSRTFPAASLVRLQDRPGLWRKLPHSAPPLDPSHRNFAWFGDAAGATWVYAPEAGVVHAEAVGVKADGASDDGAAMQVALDLLAKDGGTLDLPSGVISVTRPIVLAKRQTRLVGRSFHETYIRLARENASAFMPWTPGRAYAAGDVCTVHEAGHSNAIPYRCVTPHLGLNFNEDWAHGKWEQWCAISVRASDCSIAYCNIQVPKMGIGISVQGAARFNPQHTMFVPETDRSGYGLLLDDRNYLGQFSPGSYTHAIGPGNGFASLSQGKAQFEKGIASAGTGGGINATRIIFNQFVGDLCVHIQNGGGNAFIGNLLQSATGRNSGARPYTGGVGTGVRFGGETHFEANYFERFALDFEPSSSSAAFTASGHTSDASTRLFPLLKGYKPPAFIATAEGIAAEITDGMDFVSQNLAANGETIRPDRRGVTVSGNGAARTSISIDTIGCKIGQRLLIQANSWPFEIVSGNAVDLAGAGETLAMGQPGKPVGHGFSTCSFAEFIFTPARAWRLLWRDSHISPSGVLELAGDNQVIPANANHLAVSGGASMRSGIKLAGGPSPGYRLVLTAFGSGFALSPTTARWGKDGSPVFGSERGQVLALELLWTHQGWIEIGRTCAA